MMKGDILITYYFELEPKEAVQLKKEIKSLGEFSSIKTTFEIAQRITGVRP